MKKLELKHLAPYLPYGLKCHCSELWVDDGADDHEPITVEIVGLNEFVEIHEIGRTITEEYHYCDVFPHFRPLSDLTKEIEHDGEKFVPIEEINELFGTCELRYYTSSCNEIIEESCREDEEYTFSHQTPNCYPLYIAQKLFEWHFDVFGLIPAGLAIDINTVK